MWVRRFDSGGNDNCCDAVVTIVSDLNGNVYLTGWYGSNYPAPDWQTVKYDSEGNFKWVQRYDGPGKSTDYPTDISVNNSGNVYVTGYVWGNNNNDFATVKYDSMGNQQWVAFYDGGYGDGGWSIVTDDSGNAYVTGNSGTGGQKTDYLTIKYSTDGIEQWIARFSGPGNYIDIPCCIKLDSKGNVYVTGYASISNNNTDYCTIKYDNFGVQQWVIYYSGPISQNPYDRATSMEVDKLGNVYVTGSSGEDYATIKYSQTINVSQISSEVPTDFNLYQNYPNPFNPSTLIKFQIPNQSFVTLKVFDVNGREVANLVNENLNAGEYSYEFKTDDFGLSSGVYFYQLETSNFTQTKKMILLR